MESVWDRRGETVQSPGLAARQDAVVLLRQARQRNDRIALG